jgi:hypothetical protein
MIGTPGKMALKMRLVIGHVLDAHGGFERHDVAHLVDQEERVAMRQEPLDHLDIGAQHLGPGIKAHGMGSFVLGRRSRHRAHRWSGTPRRSGRA